MKLKPVKRATPKEEVKQKTTTKKGKTPNNLPSDEYKPIYEPMRFKVREMPSRKDPNDVVRQYVELSVKRSEYDNGLPYLWVQMYQESNFYTGYLKGKTVYLPVAMLPALMEHIEDIADQCERDGLTSEDLGE